MIRSLTAAFALCVAALAGAQTPLSPYTAEYAAEYKGRNVGTSVFSLSFDATSEIWTFASSMRAKGLLRFAAPNPVIDRSEFTIDGAAIRPLRFAHEDGSRKGEDNHTIEFDWEALQATVNGDGYSRDLPVAAGVLDRGTAQVALMQTLRAGAEPNGVSVIDEASVDAYTFVFEGRDTIETEMGSIETLRYRQQRDGSSRFTLIDLAPSLEYVPVRIEQIRDGETRSAFLIESFERQ